MSQRTDKYASFVDHPRYGRRPLVTGSNPDPLDPGVELHWNATTRREVVTRFEAITGKRWPHGDLPASDELGERIPNTAVAADLTLQAPATVAVTHYFDLERRCRDCGRRFLFFAREQKHWYEQLGFPLEADCVRCVECRKQQQGVARHREIYESLFHVRDRSEEQTLAMAESCLALIENGVFAGRPSERVRSLLNSIPETTRQRDPPRLADLRRRLLALEEERGHRSPERPPPAAS